jgi:hypothetical protein
LDVYGEESAVDSENATGSSGKNMPRKRGSNWSEKPTKAAPPEEAADSSEQAGGKNKPRKQRRRSPK